MTIGEHMKAARNAAGLSLSQLSIKTGVNRGTIHSSEAGRTFPNILNVIALADALGISIDEYIGHVPKKG